MRLSDFDYTLPDRLIAQFPATNRTESRLLQIHKNHHLDHDFSALLTLLHPGDLLVLNNTQVMQARLYGMKETGGRVEVLIERILDTKTALAHIRASKAPKPGNMLYFNNDWKVQVIKKVEALFTLRLQGPKSIIEMLDSAGTLPLPPYIKHLASDNDAKRYQTVYAQVKGAVAAPTAGLHFTESLLQNLVLKGINLAFLTLHVGSGTFQPVRVEDIRTHKMHREQYFIPEETKEKIEETKEKGKRIIAVGTTTLRALEAASQRSFLADLVGDTDIFITPGYRFKVIDTLITNFHLPKSTLLMLVAAFAGYENIMAAYQYAIDKEYRFFSYGDAMIIDRKA